MNNSSVEFVQALSFEDQLAGRMRDAGVVDLCTPEKGVSHAKEMIDVLTPPQQSKDLIVESKGIREEERNGVPTGVVGHVIERGGKSIMSMERRTGCRVAIQNDEGTNNVIGKDDGGDDKRQGRPNDDTRGAKKDDGDDAAGGGCPSYSSTKLSLAYRQARQDIVFGDIEAGLGTIESALRETLETVGDDELHESLAPLYYLRGTTLLDSVEMKRHVANAQDQEATTASAARSGSGGDVSAAIAAQEAESSDVANDLRIAWENLEMARSILSRTVVISDEVDLSAATGPNSDARDRALDLAQIHLRLGDLQEANGNYADALEDYTMCLDIRSKIFVGGFDKKVADCHLKLGSTYLRMYLRVSDDVGGSGGGDAGGALQPPQPPPNAAAAVAAAPQQEGQNVAECRSNFMRHYLACGRSIGGLVGILCGVEPKSILGDGDDAEKDGKQASSAPSHAAAAAASSLSAAASASQSDSAKVTAESSLALREIRSRVKNLTPVDPSNDADTVADLRELLDDIQLMIN